MSTSANVSVTGASCRLAASLTADAIRLGGLSAVTPTALERLLEQLPAGAWDVDLGDDDSELRGWLLALGFEQYAQGRVIARSLSGMKPPFPIPGIEFGRYRNDLAADFTRAESEALAGTPIFTEISSPTGYEEADHAGAFLVARRAGRIVGFIQAEMPQGWINWFGVVPAERRFGIGRLLVGELARVAAERGGTHLAGLCDTEDGLAFFQALEFSVRGTRRLLIRRA